MTTKSSRVNGMPCHPGITRFALRFFAESGNLLPAWTAAVIACRGIGSFHFCERVGGENDMRRAVPLTLWLVLAGSAAVADEVTDWNRIMLDAFLVPPAVGAPLAQRPAAIVAASVFDAVNGIERRYTPIHVPPAAPPGTSKRAAAFRRPMPAWFDCFPPKSPPSTRSVRSP